jgi:hypothetical protein
MENKTNWVLIIGVVVVVAVLASLVTVNLTGNTISVAKGTAGKVYTTAETYSKTEVNSRIPSINYMDAESCRHIEVSSNGYFNTSYQQGTDVNCLPDEVIGMVTHINCPSSSLNPILVGSGWYSGRVPYSLTYLCQDSAGSWEARPTQIIAYCCKVKSTGIPPKAAVKKSATKKLQNGTLIMS